MIELHKNQGYFRFYQKLSDEFVDSYCRLRRIGYNAHESLHGAKMSVQNQVALAIVDKENTLKSKVILTAYNNLKKDTEIVEKAIKYYQRMKNSAE